MFFVVWLTDYLWFTQWEDCLTQDWLTTCDLHEPWLIVWLHVIYLCHDWLTYCMSFTCVMTDYMWFTSVMTDWLHVIYLCYDWLTCYMSFTCVMTDWLVTYHLPVSWLTDLIHVIYLCYDWLHVIDLCHDWLTTCNLLWVMTACDLPVSWLADYIRFTWVMSD